MCDRCDELEREVAEMRARWEGVRGAALNTPCENEFGCELAYGSVFHAKWCLRCLILNDTPQPARPGDGGGEG